MAAPSVIQLLPRPFLPPIWLELPSLERLRIPWSGVPAPPAGECGQPVLLIPGFLAGDSSLRVLGNSLRAAGHQPHTAGIRWNVGCSEAAILRIGAAVERLADRLERRVALVGHSRGGLFARVVARRRPNLVSSVITLASPHRDQLAIHPLIRASAAALATAGALRVPDVLRWSCGGFGCCADFDATSASRCPPASAC